MTALTRREEQILCLIGQGQSSQEIAARLSISVATVSNHRKRICAKLDLHSTAKLVAFAANRNAAPDRTAAGLPEFRTCMQA